MNSLKNIKNDEIYVYAVMVIIILIICFLPSNNIITDITKNTGSLIIAFVCICLFMLLDNRLAVLFLVLLVVSYYKNMKNNLAEKFNTEQAVELQSNETDTTSPSVEPVEQPNEPVEPANEPVEQPNEPVEPTDEPVEPTNDPVTLSNKLVNSQSLNPIVEVNLNKIAENSNITNGTDERTENTQNSLNNLEEEKLKEEEEARNKIENILSSNMSLQGLSKVEQNKRIQMNDIKIKNNKVENELKNAMIKVNDNLYKHIQDSRNLCSTIRRIDENRDIIKENFLKGRIPEIIREDFIKDNVPFNNQERARNFKDSDLVKNLNGLATQNEKSGYDITGCRMITSDDDSIVKTYDTLNGPPLANVDYDTLQKEFVGTPFYPLNN